MLRHEITGPANPQLLLDPRLTACHRQATCSFQLLDDREYICALLANNREAIESECFQILDAAFVQKCVIESECFQILDAAFVQKCVQVLAGSDASDHCQFGDASGMRFKRAAGKFRESLRHKSAFFN